MAGSPPKPPPPPVGSSSSEPPTLPFPGNHPSYEELINSYLRPRVVDGTKAEFIHEADLYSADPYQLTDNHAAAITNNGERAWYFYTWQRLKGSAENRMKRNVDTGRKGSWHAMNGDVVCNGQRLGERVGFDFQETVDGNHVKTPWRMMELRLDPNVGGQKAGSSRAGQAEDESSMEVAKADAEAPATSAAVTPGPNKGADEEIGAETAASSPGRQNKADGKSADAATIGEIFADSKDPLDAAEKTEQEEPRDTRFYNFFGDDESSMAVAKADDEAPAASAVVTPGRKGPDEEIGAETAAGPGRERKAVDKDFGAETVASSPQPGHQKKSDGESADAATTGKIFADSSAAPLDAPEEAEQEPRDPRDPPPFYDFFSDSQNLKKR